MEQASLPIAKPHARFKHSAKLEVFFRSILADANICPDGPRPWDLRIFHPDFYERVMRDGSLGLGEAYMDGWWDCEALDEFFVRIFNSGLSEKISGGTSARFLALLSRFSNLQSPHRAYEVGKKHYDIGNNLYQAMLDTHLQYSCAYWKKSTSLEAAQLNKLELICQKLRLEPGMTVLDIGCGWGGLAKYAAERYGVFVLGVTISSEQAIFAKKICRDLPVEIRIEDYRSLNGRFDRIVSVGMFEHVGYKNYRTYMNIVARCLKDEGLFLLHTIGNNVSVTDTDPWIHKYIFPNSMLPSAQQITAASEGLFVMEDWHNFGADYDKTLMSWHANFCTQWEHLKARYTQRFYRMWHYYLLMCAAAFRVRRYQLWQIVFSKHGLPGGYQAVR